MPGLLRMEEMEGLAPRRWNPGFVAMRWRHLFWLLPMLALFVGVGWSWMEYLKGTVVSGQISYYPEQFTSMSDEAIAREGTTFLASKQVLDKAAIRVASSKLWGTDADTGDLRSRQRLEVDSAFGTPMVMMTVSGRTETAAIKTWEAIYDAAERIVIEEDDFRLRAEINAAKAAVLRLEHELAAERPASENDAGLTRSKLNAAKKELDRVEMGAFCGTGRGGRISVMIPPGVPGIRPPFGPWGMLGLRSIGGFGVGIFAAVVLAYALEVLKPRKVEMPG